MKSIIPPKMNALLVSALDTDFSGCSVQEIDTPEPASDEVLIQIRGSALGFPDLLMTEGKYQHKPELPFVPGGDVSGEVVALGAGVTGFAVGDRVVASVSGKGFAEYGSYPADALRKVPETLSLQEASAFGIAYLTAYVSLVRRAHIQSDDWVLVHGAAGGVGLAAVDLAKALGARVIAAAASDEKLAVVKEKYQPDATVNVSDGFRKTVKEITGGGADIIYDPVGGDIFDESTRCIAFDGRLLVVGFTSGRIASVPTNIPLIKGFSVVGVRAGEYGRQFPERGKENLDAIWTLAAEGRVKPHVHATLPLSKWRDAFEMMRNREVVGRVVIDPNQ